MFLRLVICLVIIASFVSSMIYYSADDMMKAIWFLIFTVLGFVILLREEMNYDKKK